MGWTPAYPLLPFTHYLCLHIFLRPLNGQQMATSIYDSELSRAKHSDLCSQLHAGLGHQRDNFQLEKNGSNCFKHPDKSY